MSRIRTCSLLFLLFVPGQIAAQRPAGMAVGQRVRIAHRCTIVDRAAGPCIHGGYGIVIGQLESFDGDTFRIRQESGDTTLAFPGAHILRLWVGDGRKGNFWSGAAVGTVSGMAVGGIIGSTMDFCIFSCTSAAGLGAVLGLPAGFLIGGIVGSFIESDRWQPVSMDLVPVRVVPWRGGVGLEVQLAF